MEAVKAADQLPSEHFQAMQPAVFLAPKVEVERLPIGIRIAGPMSEDVEVRFPFGTAVLAAKRIGQRPMEGVAPSDAEQLDRSLVDEVRKLLDIIVEQAVAGVQVKLSLDGRNGRQIAEDDPGHAL